MTLRSLPAALYRGGTSKGVYFEEGDLPENEDEWDDLLLTLYGSPDPMQIDGIGGSHSVTSKAMVVSPADGEASVSYRFGQVGIEKPIVDWGGNCGNLTFAIGPFALERGMINDSKVDDLRCDIVLENENTGSIVEQSVPVETSSRPRYDGDYKVHGVPGTGARISSRFLDPGGAETGETLPTGNVVEDLDVPDVGTIEASLVDVASPCVFVQAESVDLTATETPDEINSREELLERLESIRSQACERFGFVDDATKATTVSPGIPKLAVIGMHTSYQTVDGRFVEKSDFTLLGRIMSMQKAHHAYAVTGAICTAVAAKIPGTIPNEYATGVDPIVIGHPKGPMHIDVEMATETRPKAVTVHRTARKIMDGTLYYVPKT